MAIAGPSLASVESAIDSFEAIYAEAHDDASRVPWADLRPNPAMINWLNAIAPSLVRCGARVCVVGCGLGDDAQELIRRGYDMTAFDCSRTAIEWAKRRDPQNARCYVQADLFQPPPRWRHRFDLVLEVNTLHALPPELQFGAVSAIGDLVSPRGYLLVIGRVADQPVAIDSGPPWPMTADQLLEAAALARLAPLEPPSIFADDGDPPTQRIRAVFKRAS